MQGECIIDMYAHVYRTAEIGRQAMQGCARPQRWKGVIDELRATMRDTGIWRAVITTITPTQTMREKALALLPPDLSHESRQKAETEIRERLLQRMDHNNLWGCEVGRTYPEFLPFINLDPILMDAVTIRQKVRETCEPGGSWHRSTPRTAWVLRQRPSCLADLRDGAIVPTADPLPDR